MTADLTRPDMGKIYDERERRDRGKSKLGVFTQPVPPVSISNGGSAN